MAIHNEINRIKTSLKYPVYILPFKSEILNYFSEWKSETKHDKNMKIDSSKEIAIIYYTLKRIFTAEKIWLRKKKVKKTQGANIILLK